MNKKIFRRGFTLIELLVVISIIGILSSIFLNKIGDFRNRAEDARRVADLRHVQTLLELFYNQCGFYPNSQTPSTPGTDASGHIMCGATTAAAGEITWANLKIILSNYKLGTKATSIPSDPSGDRTYHYASDGSGYVLRADLKEDNTVLKDAPSNTIFTLDCSKRDATNSVYNYCIEF